jgi:hypothetical protein
VAGLLLLLPRRAALANGARMPALERIMARGMATPAAADPGHPCLEHVFDLPARPWPLAAITRDLDAGDCSGATWLRADPALVQADLAGARLMAVGEIGLTASEARALAAALAPLFGDHGMELSAPQPERWYLRLSPEAPLPLFSPPWAALGDDPRGHGPSGPQAARWVRLRAECEVLLHAHPVNAARAAAGRPVANGVWFWGGGARPARVGARVDAVASDDPLLAALARAADIPRVRAAAEVSSGNPLLDLRALRDPALLEAQWIGPAWAALRRGRLARLEVVFADGGAVAVGRAGAFASWRRPRRLA